MSCFASSLYESRPLRASSALPCTPPGQQHRYITQRHRFDKCPPEGGERRDSADGPRKGTKKCAREGGRKQSAGELRSPLSRYGFAFAPDSTPLVGLRPPDPPYGGRLPLLAIQKRRLESAPLRSGKEKQASRLARRPKTRRSELRPGVGQGLPVCVACTGF
jgi:hypothetical protein